MKHLFTFLILLVGISLSAQSQRYIDDVFTEVQVTENVVYGNNATVEFFSVTGEAVPQDLVMDVYEPVGDDPAVCRPLVIYLHGGTFLPEVFTNSLSADKNAQHIEEICTSLAKKGYVVAAINYRRGWNPLLPPGPDLQASLVQAAYRGIQDLRTCIRYFKYNYDQLGNEFQVNACRIAAFGEHSGAYLSIGAATLDDYSKMLIPKFLLPGFIPMVPEQVFGDIHGTSYGILPDSLGNPADTFCIPNHTGYSSDFQLAMNLVGATVDTTWIEEGQIPIVSIHDNNSVEDPEGCGIVFGPSPLFEVCGSGAVQEAAEQKGLNEVFKGSDCLLDLGVDSLSTYLQLQAPGGVIDPWQYCVEPDTCNNPAPSEAFVQTYIDSIVNYVAPRLYVGLELCDIDCDCIIVGTYQPQEIGMQIYPNPATDYVQIESPGHAIKEAILINLNGQVVQRIAGQGRHQLEIYRSGLPAGLYFLQVQVEEGTAVQKLIFR